MSAIRGLVLMHAMDPRGEKIGGIETHVRLILAHHPATTTVLFVGIDERGDLPLGAASPLIFEGRAITFLPVAHVPSLRINEASATIMGSTTLRFALGLLQYTAAIRRSASSLPRSCEIERYEFAGPARLLGMPLVMFAHNDGTRADAMDSLLKRYWWVHALGERIALTLATRVFAVNSSIAARIARLSRSSAVKTAVMSVSVDPMCFAVKPFESRSGVFRVVYAGRLDAFKNPALMFTSLANLATRLDGSGFERLEFHYVGASDPTRFTAFAAIAAATVRHGPRNSVEVAAIMARCHAGIITSVFEGMPCYLLEMIASGRPVVALALPQYSPLIVPGISGSLVAPTASEQGDSAAIAGALAVVAADIASGSLEPDVISALARPFSTETQLSRLFACHESLADGGERH